jgi:hypothetical protein
MRRTAVLPGLGSVGWDVRCRLGVEQIDRPGLVPSRAPWLIVRVGRRLVRFFHATVKVLRRIHLIFA